jgi:hypothetical protein
MQALFFCPNGKGCKHGCKGAAPFFTLQTDHQNRGVNSTLASHETGSKAPLDPSHAGALNLIRSGHSLANYQPTGNLRSGLVLA